MSFLDGVGFQNIDESVLYKLVNAPIGESRELEYKAELKLDQDRDKQEFQKDVSALANSIGGYLIYGIHENKNAVHPVPQYELRGIEVTSTDKLSLTIEQILLSGIEPRLNVSGKDIKFVPLSPTGSNLYALVIRVGPSLLAPHRVKTTGKFFARHSSGVFEMDVEELRSAFSLTVGLGEKVLNFRKERITSLKEGNSPVTSPQGPRIIVHLIPFEALIRPSIYDLNTLFPDSEGLLYPPIYDDSTDFGKGYQPRYNIDGVLTQREFIPNRVTNYLQVFRSGIIEYVDGTLLNPSLRLDVVKTVPIKDLEKAFRSEFKRLLRLQENLGVKPPIMIGVSLLDVAGYTAEYAGIGTRNAGKFVYINSVPCQIYELDKPELILPDLFITSYGETAEDYQTNTVQLFDILSQAFGIPKSPYSQNPA